MVLAVRIYINKGSNKDRTSWNITWNTEKLSEDHITLTNLIQQRNNISRALNLKQQKIAQFECEVGIYDLPNLPLIQALKCNIFPFLNMFLNSKNDSVSNLY